MSNFNTTEKFNGTININSNIKNNKKTIIGNFDLKDLLFILLGILVGLISMTIMFFIIGINSSGNVIVDGEYSHRYHIEDWSDIIAIAAGRNHMIGLSSDGSLIAASTDNANDNGPCNVQKLYDKIMDLNCKA